MVLLNSSLNVPEITVLKWVTPAEPHIR
jgi:hypothetical protein